MSKIIITHRESFLSGLQKLYDDAHGKVSRNLINLTENDLSLPIYRIISVSRLENILTTNQLGLVRPKVWDDPFENWLLKSKFILKNGNEASVMSSQDFVGQCWTATEESDAMWRIYSPEKSGVKIKTTIGKLLNELLNQVEDENKFEISKFIGKVKYLSKEEIIAEFGRNVKNSLQPILDKQRPIFINDQNLSTRMRLEFYLKPLIMFPKTSLI
jgi:hypothetical protein